MPRRRGELEEKLRSAVIAYVRGKETRAQDGRNKEIAERIGRPPSWLTEYMDGENHANLDTSLALMRAIGWTVNENLAELISSEIEPEVLNALRDPQVSDLIREFQRLRKHPGVRASLLSSARSLADQFGTPLPTHAPTRAAAPGSRVEARTKREPSQRR